MNECPDEQRPSLESSSRRFVEVAPFVPVRGRFTYVLEDVERAACAGPGTRLVVPFGRRQVVGVVLRLDVPAPAVEVRPVLEVLEERPCIPEDLLELLNWASDYYYAAPGELIRAALPAALQLREQRIVQLTDLGREVLRAEGALLQREDLSATADEVKLLQRLSQRTRGLRFKTPSRAGNERAIWRRLIERKWVSVATRNRTSRKKRTDWYVSVHLIDTEEVLLPRAPRQAALLERLRATGQPVLLSQLEGMPRDARGLLKKLETRGLIALREIEVSSDPFDSEPVWSDVHHELTPEQCAAVDSLTALVRERRFYGVLLHGVTGSGKTEVYLRVIAEVLRQGRNAIVLVPEIALTPQLAARFRARFGELVAVLHSGLGTSERSERWRQIREGKLRIVVGARSGVFAPIQQLGVVIVDEEHDASFKQDEGVRYHARDLALMRGKQAGAVVVLGSATPSLESSWGVQMGRLQLLELPRRATPRPLPQVEIIDLRTFRADPAGMLSAPLALAIAEVLNTRQQVILFLNRRGTATFVLCPGCGYVFRCMNCSVALTQHRRRHRLLCHYCGYSEESPQACPKCRSGHLEFLGIGTQRVEDELSARFPEARVARLDRDAASGGGLKELIRQVQCREVDILVGTQMVTKGHDFPDVTLVGVLCADLGLQFPDFRAAERTFQLLTQVAGRAGRGAHSGRVMIQTYAPEHPAIVAARDHDFSRFSRSELPSRREAGYPPFVHLIAVHADGVDAEAVAQTAREIAHAVRLAAQASGSVSVLGPTEAPIQRLKGRTRWMILLKSPSRPHLRRVADEVMQVSTNQRVGSGVRVSLDVDPMHML